MATMNANTNLPLPNQRDPAYAGAYGYRSLGAYSAGLDASGNSLPAPSALQEFQATPYPDATAPAPAPRTPPPPPVPKRSGVGGSNPTGLPNLVDEGLRRAPEVAQMLVNQIPGQVGEAIRLGSSAVTEPLINPYGITEDLLGKGPTNELRKIVSAPADLVSRGIETGTSEMGTVICTEIVRQGSATQYDLEIEYRFAKHLPECVLRGYRLWAVPYVSLMRKSPLVSRITKPFAKAFMQESAALLGLRKHSMLGGLILLVGLPVCAVLGVSLLALSIQNTKVA